MQINYNNFFRWYANEADDDTVNIQRLGDQSGICQVYRPVLVPGQQAGIFINLNQPFFDADNITDMVLRFVGNVDISIPLAKTTATGGYRLYAVFVVPDIAHGTYQFEVFNNASQVQKVISNKFRVTDGGYTSLVRYRNSRDLMFYDYEQIPGFYNEFRLHLSLAGYVSENGATQLQSVATGLRRNLNGTLDKSFQLDTYYFDDGAHDAMMCLLEHDDIQINGRAYIKKSAYIPNVRVNSKLSVGRAEVYEQAYSTVNKYGDTPAIRKQAKFLAVSSATVQIEVYTATNSLVATYEDKVYDTDIPIGGYLKVTGSGNAEVFHDTPGGLVRETVTIPYTLSQLDFYGNDYILVTGDYAKPVLPSRLNVTNIEQVTPYVDANAIVYINGIEQSPININETRSYTLQPGDVVVVKAFTELVSEAASPMLYSEVTDDGGQLADSPKGVAATPGNSSLITFTAGSDKTYNAIVRGYGN